MITLTFILIAYFIRKKHLPEDASILEKAIYYSVCVLVTPLFGPKVFKWLVSPNPDDKDQKEETYGCIIPDF